MMNKTGILLSNFKERFSFLASKNKKKIIEVKCVIKVILRKINILKKLEKIRLQYLVKKYFPLQKFALQLYGFPQFSMVLF